MPSEQLIIAIISPKEDKFDEVNARPLTYPIYAFNWNYFRYSDFWTPLFKE